MSASVDIRAITRPKLRSCLSRQTAIASLAVVVGVLGVLRDPWFSAVLPASHRLDALFGLLLWALVIEEFNGGLQRSSPSAAVRLADCSRRLSRVIYVVLYLVIGSTQVMGITRWLWRDEVSSVGMNQIADPESRVAAFFASPTNAQILLMYGFTALVLIRILSYRRRRIADHAVGSPR